VKLNVRLDSFQSIAELIAGISQSAREAARDAARQVVAASGKRAKDRLRDPARPPRMGRGVYFRSIRTGADASRFPVVGSVNSTAPFAGVIEFGSMPHEIRARNGKALFWRGASAPVKKVNHPGTPAFRVLGEAAEEAAASLPALFKAAFRKIFK